MPYSDEWWEWHLTPRGWEPGSSREDYKGTVRREPPQDRVLTFLHTEHIGSAFSKEMKVSDAYTWSCGDEGIISQLKEQFGEKPSAMWHKQEKVLEDGHPSSS